MPFSPSTHTRARRFGSFIAAHVKTMCVHFNRRSSSCFIYCVGTVTKTFFDRNYVYTNEYSFCHTSRRAHAKHTQNHNGMGPSSQRIIISECFVCKSRPKVSEKSHKLSGRRRERGERKGKELFLGRRERWAKSSRRSAYASRTKRFVLAVPPLDGNELRFRFGRLFDRKMSRSSRR